MYGKNCHSKLNDAYSLLKSIFKQFTVLIFKDKRMVCSTSAAAICENANYNGDKFNEDLLASIKENNSGDGRSHIANPTVGAGIVEYTV